MDETPRIRLAAGERRAYGFHMSAFCARYWQPETQFEAGTRVRPPTTTGYEYEALDSGLTGRRVPEWTRTEGDAVTDGSVRWVARRITASSLRRLITASAWASSPAGLTIEQNAFDSTLEQRTRCFFAPTQLGTTFEVVNTVTFTDGTILEPRLIVEVDGE